MYLREHAAATQPEHRVLVTNKSSEIKKPQIAFNRRYTEKKISANNQTANEGKQIRKFHSQWLAFDLRAKIKTGYTLRFCFAQSFSLIKFSQLIESLINGTFAIPFLVR